jgi:hypothetical protein
MNFNRHLQETPKGIIFCDMDGVLVDLIGGMTKLAGVPRIESQAFELWLEAQEEVRCRTPTSIRNSSLDGGLASVCGHTSQSTRLKSCLPIHRLGNHHPRKTR